MVNPISNAIRKGTVGELLVQLRLLQCGVQAAPPMKDSGNDLIALRGFVMRTIQVKTTTGEIPRWPPARCQYHLLAVVRLEGEDVLPAVRTRLSVHQVGVADLLDAAKLRQKLPRTTILLGLVPDAIELGVELSEPVRAALPRLVEAVAAEVRALGFAIEQRSGDEQSDDEAMDNRDRAGGFFVQSVRRPRPADAIP